MFIPLYTDRPPRRRPLMMQGLIVINLLVYLAGLVGEYGGSFDGETMAVHGWLSRRDFAVWQLITYQFLHAPNDVMHVAFNMLFLWVFGGPVEDRLGRVGFLAFYLIGGSVSGLGHMLVDNAPVIGASGSVACVTGAFLALFPRSRIVVFFFGIFALPALWVIGFYFALDFLRQFRISFFGGGDNIAYMAHLAGYVYGFGICFALLGFNILKREEFDVFFLFKQWRRRAAFRAASRQQIGGAWDSASADTGARLAKQAKKRNAVAPSPLEQRMLAARAEIVTLLTDHKLEDATRRYRDFAAEFPDSAFGETHQRDLANQLFQEGDHQLAIAAYERLLQQYPGSGSRAEVQLIAALIYGRKLGQPIRARDMLREAQPNLRDEGHRALAAQLDAELPPTTST